MLMEFWLRLGSPPPLILKEGNINSKLFASRGMISSQYILNLLTMCLSFYLRKIKRKYICFLKT